MRALALFTCMVAAFVGCDPRLRNLDGIIDSQNRQAGRGIFDCPTIAAPSYAGGGEWTWTQGRVDDTYKRGLSMWRKPGSVDGQACSHCHSPDGIDLAVIGYQDDAILRHAHKHLAPSDALVVRDFIHAQRRRFNLRDTCSTNWRPFQPGGEVLPGKTAAERDIAFMRQMKKRNMLLFTGAVKTLDDAKKAWAELQAIDLRKLPIGTALPRWSEDRFNGPEHQTNNDYLPPLPTIPNDPVALYAKEDAYLANPTDQGLLALLDMQRDSNDGGYAASINTGPVWTRCGASGGKLSFVVDYLTRFKRSSLIVAQHFFRMKLLHKSFDFDRQVPVAGASPIPNPMWQIGQRNAQPTECAGIFGDGGPMPELLATLTPDMTAELSARDVATNKLMDLSVELADPWMTLGTMFDQGINTTRPESNPLSYWAGETFAHKVFHLPFMYAHRKGIQTRYWEAHGIATKLPTHPLLDGTRFLQMKLQTAAPYDELNYTGYEETGADANRLKGNINRMFLLLQRDLLQKGGPVFDDPTSPLFPKIMGEFQGFARQMVGVINTPAQAPLLPDAALYTTDLDNLAAEVRALIAQAPRAEGNPPVGGN